MAAVKAATADAATAEDDEAAANTWLSFPLIICPPSDQPSPISPAAAGRPEASSRLPAAKH